MSNLNLAPKVMYSLSTQSNLVTLHKSSNTSSYHSPSANFLTLTYQKRN